MPGGGAVDMESHKVPMKSSSTRLVPDQVDGMAVVASVARRRDAKPAVGVITSWPRYGSDDRIQSAAADSEGPSGVARPSSEDEYPLDGELRHGLAEGLAAEDVDRWATGSENQTAS